MIRIIGLLTLCVVFAVLRAAFLVLIAAGALTLLYAFVTRPRDTVIMIATVGLVGLASVKPLAFILTLGAVALAALAVAGIAKDRSAQASSPRASIGRCLADLD
jgi:hypothetical protein